MQKKFSKIITLLICSASTIFVSEILDLNDITLSKNSHIHKIKSFYLSKEANIISTALSSLSGGRTRLTIVEELDDQNQITYSASINRAISLLERDEELLVKITSARSKAIIKNSVFFKYKQLFGQDENLKEKLNYLEQKISNLYTKLPEFIVQKLAHVLMINNNSDFEKKYVILKNHLKTKNLIIKKISQSKRAPGKTITVKINYKEFAFDLKLQQAILDQKGSLGILTFQLDQDQNIYAVTGERYGVSSPEKHRSLAAYVKSIADNMAKQTP